MSCSPDTLLRQAGMTAEVYLIDALSSIEKRGVELTYPEIMDKYPLIVAALINASAVDFATGTAMNFGEELIRSIDQLVER